MSDPPKHAAEKQKVSALTIGMSVVFLLFLVWFGAKLLYPALLFPIESLDSVRRFVEQIEGVEELGPAATLNFCFALLLFFLGAAVVVFPDPGHVVNRVLDFVESVFKALTRQPHDVPDRGNPGNGRWGIAIVGFSAVFFVVCWVILLVAQPIGRNKSVPLPPPARIDFAGRLSEGTQPFGRP